MITIQKIGEKLTMKPQLQINLFNELIVDNFAGVAVASTLRHLAGSRPPGGHSN